MGTTVLLSQLTAATELLVIDLVTQQDPEPDPQLSCGCYFRFPQPISRHLSGSVPFFEAQVLTITAASRTPLWLDSGWGCRGRHLSTV